MKILKWALYVAILAVTIWYVVAGVEIINKEYYSEEAKYRRVVEMYENLNKATGQRDIIPPMQLSESAEVNAATYADRIVINKGIIDFAQSDDEIALVVGHEMAHAILKHLELGENVTVEDIRKAEADADNYGAFLMMKAGYNICKGREIWKRLLEQNGDNLNQNHPDYAYRYEQLNVNCN